MEEEGTVVYFKTSPSVCDLHEDDDELIFREEDNDIREFLDKSAENLPTDQKPSSLQHELTLLKGTKEEIVPTTWKPLKFGRWFSEAWVIAKRWLFLTDLIGHCEVKHRKELLDSISSSPLLTEDDFHLLQFIISHQHGRHGLTPTELPHVQRQQLKLSQNSCQNHNKHTVSLVTFLTSIVFAIAAILLTFTLSMTILSVLLSVGVVTIIGLAVARWRVKLGIEQRQNKAVARVKMYLEDFESLLSLITQMTRLIRETEIISHGFSRPSQTVPITKLELQGSTAFQCQLLRKKLFSVCHDGVRSTRRATQQLFTDFKTREEFDGRGDYLAFRPLGTLHQFMTDDERNLDDHLPQGEVKDAPTVESLESLKDACNLLAVQNSEMLRRLALVVSCSSISVTIGNKDTPAAATLTAVVDYITPPHMFVSQASESLRWSIDFHKNYLFGEPPNDKRLLTKSKDASSRGHNPLETVAQEVHCMDLKTQVTLQRIRELGSWLGEHLGESLESETEVDSRTESLEYLRQQLSTVEQDVRGIVEHIEECHRSLDRVDRVQDNDEEGSHGSPQREEGESPDDAEGGGTAQPAPVAEEESSEDEMVFEAYVSPLDVSAVQEDSVLGDEDVKNQKESQENSLRMINELNSVLAVRNDEKQRRRELRQRKKHGQVASREVESKNISIPKSQQDGDGSLLPSIQEVGVVTNNSKELATPTAAASTEDEQVKQEMTKKFENETREKIKSLLPSSGEQLTSSSMATAAIAQAVAAAALKAGRVGKEEMFYDEDSCSASSEEEEHTMD